MRAMSCLLLAFVVAAHAAEKSAITLVIKGDDGESIVIRLLENQKYQSYMTDEINLRELDLPEHFSKEKFTEIWKTAEGVSKNEVEGTFQLPPDTKESFTLILKLNDVTRTYTFTSDTKQPKPSKELESVRWALSGLTKW